MPENDQRQSEIESVLDASLKRTLRWDWRELVAALGVILSLLFVGLELRNSNMQSRAASYQAIGLATAELHLNLDRDRIKMIIEATYRPESLTSWSAVDWEYYQRAWLAVMRIFETLLLQVEQGLLPQEAINNLGYSLTPQFAWEAPAFVCLWPGLKDHMGAALRELLEAQRPETVFDCSHIDMQEVYRSGPLPRAEQ